MNGGKITGNETGANGGGFLSGGTVYLKGGEISGNTASNANAGAHASGGTMDIYYGFVFGTNYNASTNAAGSNVIVGGSATLNFCFEWNAAKQAETSLGGFDSMKIDGQDISYPTTKGTKNGVTYIIIDGEMEIADRIAIPADAKVVLKGKSGTADKLLYIGTSSNRALTVSSGAELTMENITVDVSGSTNASGARGVVVASGGTLNIKDGAVITGGNINSGAGIYNQGTVVMSGGSITGNSATGGAGGVNTNGETSSFTITGGSITNNTAAQEGAGIYVHNSGTLVIGGSANVTDNTTLGKTSNICIDEVCAASTTIQADFAGKAGFHAEFRYTDDATTVNTMAVIASGYEFDASQIFADDSNVTASASDGNLILTSTAVTLNFTSPNGSVSASTVKSDFYRLGAITAPDGYADATFVGYVKVSGYGTSPVAEAIHKNGYLLTAEELETIYPIWVKVEAEKGAAVKLGETSGIRFIATVDSAILKAVGINVKSGKASGDGYYRGMVLATKSTDLSAGLNKSNNQLDVKVSSTTWGSALYKDFTNKTLASGKDSFSVAITYDDSSNYNKGVAFRAYIEIIVNGKSSIVYSDFAAPSSIVDSDNATYGDVHARSARAVVRKLYFNGNTTEEQVKAKVGDYYKQILAIAGYAAFPVLTYPTAEQLAYYLSPVSRGGDITDDDQINHIAIFGNSLVTGYSMADMIEQFGLLDGNKVVISSVAMNNMTTSGSLSLRELFEYDSTNYKFLDADGNATDDYTKLVIKTTDKSSLSSKFNSILECSETPVDKFYIILNREIVYTSTNAYAQQEPIAAKAVAYNVLKKFPNAEFVIVAPPAFGDEDFRIANSKWYTTSAGMKTAMNNAAASIQTAIQSVCSNSVSVMSLADYHANFSLEGITLTATETNINNADTTLQRHPTMAGAYLNACLLYSHMTGSCPKGIEYFARVPESEAVALQNEAHRLINCAASGHSHIPLEYGVISGTGDYTLAGDSNMPESSKWNVLLATLMAYDAREGWVQYDQKVLNRNVADVNTGYRDYRRADDFDISSPEDASSQNLLFTDCSDWITAAFEDAFPNAAIINYRTCAAMYQNKSLIGDVFTWTDEDVSDGLAKGEKDLDGNYVAYVNGSTTASTSIGNDVAKAKYYFVNHLQPGDVILYIHYPDSERTTFYGEGGHVVLYIGNGLIMHCSGDQAGGGGSDYRIESQRDLFELPGAIQVDPIDILLDPASPRYIFSEAAVSILRPDYANYDIDENAQNRLDNLLGIVAYKTTTAPNGVTVSAGGEVTFTFTVENRTEYLRDVEITDTIPADLTHISGGTLSGSVVSFNLTLKPYETATVSYTVTVNSSASGTIAMDSAYINGVKLGATPVNVADTLTTDQQTAFVKFVKENGSSYTDAYALAKAAYAELGISFTSSYSTASKVLSSSFTYGASGTRMYYTCRTTMPIVADNLFGGLNLYATTAKGTGNTTDRNLRTKDVCLENLVVGDLIVFIPKDEATSTNTTYAGAECCIYLGNGEFAVCTGGAYALVSGSAAVEIVDSLLGMDLYCVARPSMVF